MTNNGVADAANVQLDGDLRGAPDRRVDHSVAGLVLGLCNLGTITAGQAPVTIDVQASAGTQDTGFEDYPSSTLLKNTAIVSAPVGTEINPDDNSASAAISTLPLADTSITKTFSPAQPVAGGPVTYTLTVHSDGPGTVDFVAADLLPAALQKPPSAISISGGTGVCQFDPTGESIGALRPDPVHRLRHPPVRSRRGPRDHHPGHAGARQRRHPGEQPRVLEYVLPGTGVFSFEPDFSNNDDLVSFTPGTVDVGITKSVVGSSTVAVGDIGTFRLVASNSGTVAATNVVVTDTLPAGLEAVECPPAAWRPARPSRCALGTLAPGSEQTIDLRVRATAAGAGSTLTNRASIRSD